MQSEERANKFKTLLVKTKKDLADAKKSETEQRSTEAAMHGQIEHMTQKLESVKVEMSDLVGENTKLQDQLRSSNDANVRTLRSLEQRNQSLQEDLQLAHSELQANQAEFESYKVRKDKMEN